MKQELSDADADTRRGFHVLLGVIVVAALGPRLYLAALQYIDYYGYWHLFIARQRNWPNFFSEVRENAHPPLYFLLLRGVLRFGNHSLVYRSISLVSALGSVWLLGKCSFRAGTRPALALVAALTFAFSMNAVWSRSKCDPTCWPRFSSSLPSNY